MYISYDVWHMIIDMIMSDTLMYSYTQNDDRYLFDQLNALVLINKPNRRQVYKFIYDHPIWVNMECLVKTNKRILRFIRLLRKSRVPDANSLKSIFHYQGAKTPLKLIHCRNVTPTITCIFKTSEELELLVFIDARTRGDDRKWIVTGIQHYYENINTKYIGFSLRVNTFVNYYDPANLNGKKILVFSMYRSELDQVSEILLTSPRSLREKWTYIKLGAKVPKFSYIEKYEFAFGTSGNTKYILETLAHKKGNITTSDRASAYNEKFIKL